MTSVNLAWSADGNIDSYSIYRSEAPIDTSNLPAAIATNVTTKSYSDASAVAGKLYYYRVGAIAGGTMKISGEISISTTVEYWTPAVLNAAMWIEAENATKNGSSFVNQYSATPSNHFFTGYASAVTIARDAGIANNFAYVVPSSMYGFYSKSAREDAKSLSAITAFIIMKDAGSSSNHRPAIDIAGRLKVGVRNESGVRNPYFDVGLSSGGAKSRHYSSLNIATNWAMVLIEYIYTTGAYRIFVDGVVTDSGNSTITGITDTSNHTGVLLGMDNSWGAFFTGSFATPLFVKQALTDTQIDKLFGWAAHKYGLTAKLPANHPYKTVKPLT